MLNQEGINQLKDDLRANASHYSQNKFGVITNECGTEACCAGMCLLRKVGMKDFTALVEAAWDNHTPEHTALMGGSLKAAAEQLGLTILTEEEYERIAESEGRETDGLPTVFSSANYWPLDLRARYSRAERNHDHAAMAEVACDALDRMDQNGLLSGEYDEYVYESESDDDEDEE